MIELMLIWWFDQNFYELMKIMKSLFCLYYRWYDHSSFVLISFVDYIGLLNYVRNILELYIGCPNVMNFILYYFRSLYSLINCFDLCVWLLVRAFMNCIGCNGYGLEVLLMEWWYVDLISSILCSVSHKLWCLLWSIFGGGAYVI